MATAQTEARMKAPSETYGSRNSRRNEIVAVFLFASSVLLALCLVSYYPNDPSWNTEATGGTENWIGAVGANVADFLLQFFGLGAALLPVLLFAAAWRRFRTRRINAPLARIAGLVLLMLAVAALLALYVSAPLVDRSFNAGGLIGALIADLLAGALNTVGATVMLAATASVGLLLATNFSFALAYDRLVAALSNPSGWYQRTMERIGAWRAARRERAMMRAELRREARESREAERDEPSISKTESTKGKTGSAAAIRRAADASTRELDGQTREDEVRARLARAEAELAAIVPVPAGDYSGDAQAPDVALEVQEPPAAPSARRTGQRASSQRATQAERADDELSEMMRTAAVVRTEAPDESGALAAPEKGRSTPKREAADAASLLNYRFPELEYLNAPPPRCEQADEELLQIAKRVAEKCREFNVTGQIKHICPGPVVTTYEFKPDPGVKYSRVTGLVDDLCIALEAESVRIDRLPGKPHVGIEVPNPERETIFIREVLESRQFRESESKLSLALGKTIDGMNYVADLTRMPHLLIAGATGTGKSVCLNSLVVSVLYKARPDEVKFIMIDPKRLELGLYADIPHLATPIITEPKKASNALKWAVAQMEQRYKQLAQWGVRNIDGYNAEVERRNNVLDFDDEGQPHKTLPYIVILIDELADLMMTCGGDVEEAITRLAQMARAVGIHLILATQRPSVDVITGLIKANFPSRIAFRVSSKVDSRTIIDTNGAEQLLGRGDMLFLPPGTSRLVRVHGAYLDEQEVSKVVDHIKAQGGAPVYDESITQSEEEAAGLEDSGGERDELFEQALRICVEMKRASTSVLQRRLRIGYGRAAAILDAMEREGFIGQADGARPRPVLGRAFETVSHWDDLQNDSPEEF